MRILVVEDDVNLNRQLSDTLKEAGYVVDQAFDGEEGHFLGDTEPYDAIILDIGLPEMDGVTVLEKWRGAGRTVPVLILTARDRWSDKVAGIDAGADDYVTKPFDAVELLARVRAMMRLKEMHDRLEDWNRSLADTVKKQVADLERMARLKRYLSPQIAETLRLVLGWAWTYVIVAELIGASSGIGHMIIDSQALLNTGQIIFGIIVIGVIGLISDLAFKWANQKLFPWSLA